MYRWQRGHRSWWECRIVPQWPRRRSFQERLGRFVAQHRYLSTFERQAPSAGFAGNHLAITGRSATRNPGIGARGHVPGQGVITAKAGTHTGGLSTGFDGAVVRANVAFACVFRLLSEEWRVIVLDCVNSPRDEVQGRSSRFASRAWIVHRLGAATVASKYFDQE